MASVVSNNSKVSEVSNMPGHSVVLGVAGGVAAYKAVELLRLLRESGLDVDVVPTKSALRFVGEPTWASLSGKPVATEVWVDTHEVRHVRLGQHADVVIVAPATADLIARAAHGIADDLLANILLTARCPVLMAPAMHTEMWEHPATQHNVALLRSRGVVVLEPDSGRLTGADSGPGRLPDPHRIAEAVHDVLRRQPAADLLGYKVVISAGGTREDWDPVRFLGNASSGRQGVELARTAIARGAVVTLVAASLEVDPPAGANLVRVRSALDLRSAMLEAAVNADVVVMAAAVADFRPASKASSKVKKQDAVSDLTLELIKNPDILAELVELRAGASPLIVGFAAETTNSAAELLAMARAKLTRKGCDLLVANDVTVGVFGSPDNAVTIVGVEDFVVEVPRASKAVIADAVWDAVSVRLASQTSA